MSNTEIAINEIFSHNIGVPIYGMEDYAAGQLDIWTIFSACLGGSERANMGIGCSFKERLPW